MQAESERVLFRDADPENGFVLLPDQKWVGIDHCCDWYGPGVLLQSSNSSRASDAVQDQSQVEDLYLQVSCTS